MSKYNTNNLEGFNFKKEKIILLDRNIVIHIKKSLASEKNENMSAEEKYSLNERLKKIDKKFNRISPILSVIEGKNMRRESADEMRETLKEECEVIDKFFKYAKTDYNYFQQPDNFEAFVKTFTQHGEESFNDYVSFIKDVLQKKIIHQPVNPKDKITIENELFELAKKHSVSLSHPVFIVTLSVLYGNEDARKVINPKRNYQSDTAIENAAYNSVSDLIVLSRLGIIKATNKNIHIEYVSFDKGLSAIMKKIKRDSERNIEEGSIVKTEMNITFNREFFPCIDDENLNRIFERIIKNKTTRV